MVRVLQKQGQGIGAAALTVMILVLLAGPAQAYVGPGAGLTAIGTVIALVAAVLLAIVGFVWYPVKRLMRAKKQDQSGEKKPS